MKTVIMAGGTGSRISSVAQDIPKPMICLDGIPVLEREIECLREQGYKDIIITVSHLSNLITDYFKDGSGLSPATGKRFGVNIEYFVEERPLGNAGALFHLQDKLTEDFLLLNGDLVFDVDFDRFVAFHRKNGATATLFTHPNSHPYDSGLIIANEGHIVQQWLTKEDHRPTYYQNRVNAGLHVLSPKIFEKGIDRPKIDLDRQILKPLSGTGRMFAYDSPEYVKDMGTPDRYQAVCQDIRSGKIKMKNLRRKQKAIFLDRDGTINRYVGFLRDIANFELLPGVADAIKRINASGYLAIVITNQPVVARGEVTFAQLREIHNKMETLLGLEGAYLDGLYFCPHHPHRGFEGEIPELKIPCECRKPEPGMLLKAADDFNIDLQTSWMVGDGQADVESGKAAGCQTTFIGDGTGCYGQTLTAPTLEDAIDQILKEGIFGG